MSELLTNLVELVKMIFACIIKPNYGSSNVNFTLLNVLFNPSFIANNSRVISILLLPFGLLILGVSIAMVKRLLCRN